MPLNPEVVNKSLLVRGVACGKLIYRHTLNEPKMNKINQGQGITVFLGATEEQHDGILMMISQFHPRFRSPYPLGGYFVKPLLFGSILIVRCLEFRGCPYLGG